jgi:hypothetical protein
VLLAVDAGRELGFSALLSIDDRKIDPLELTRPLMLERQVRGEGLARAVERMRLTSM